LSDPDLGELSVETWTADLEAVVDAAGLERFALLGVSQGAAVAVAYAARHPTRVSELVLYGGYVRGRRVRGQANEEDALVAAIRAGWDTPNPTFRHVFSMMFLPHGTPEEMSWYDDLLRRSTSAETAAELFRARGLIDVTELAPQVRAPTLVLHASDDRMVPVEEGRRLAALVPGAHFVMLESATHILLEQEPAWNAFLSEVDAFLGTGARRGPPLSVEALSARELEVLELVAAGLTNEAIAERLVLSVRTVERHLTNIYRKLRVSGKVARASAAALFVRLHEPVRWRTGTTCRPPEATREDTSRRRCHHGATFLPCSLSSDRTEERHGTQRSAGANGAADSRRDARGQRRRRSQAPCT
jgi:pimeloyl-ACP methyl ester carboxylesterase